MKSKIGLFPIVFLTFVILLLPIHASAESDNLEYVKSVVLETGNIWKRHLVEPLSKVWEPWFAPKTSGTGLYISSTKKTEKENIVRGGEVLSVSTSSQKDVEGNDVSTGEVLSWLKDLFLSQNRSASVQAPTIYHSSGVTQGLADSLSRSVNEINSSIGGDVSTLQSNSVFNTSVLSVDAVNTRVGIGTSTPTDTLSVNGAVYLAQVSAPSNTSNRLYNTAGNLYWAGNLIGGASAGVWETDGTSVWRTSGNVGIGTTTPQDKLEVLGNITSYGVLSSVGTTSSAAQLYLLDEVNGYGGIDIYTYSSDMFGTAHPYINLISSQGSQSAPTRVLAGNDLGTLNFYGQADSGLEVGAAIGAVAAADFTGSTAQSDLYFTTNKSEKARITSAGRFGIGTTSPFAKLSVESTAGQAQFAIGSSTATSFIVDRNGNVGIGTANPNYKLHTLAPNNNLYNQFSASYGAQFINADGATVASSNNLFYITTYGLYGDPAYNYKTFLSQRGNGTDYSNFMVFANGNVGIGTTSPTAKLHVYPNANNTKALILQGDNNASANIQEWQNSSGALLSTFSNSSGYGTFNFYNNAATYISSIGVTSGNSLTFSTPYSGVFNFSSGQSGQSSTIHLTTAEGKISGIRHFDVANANGRLLNVFTQPGVAISFSPAEVEAMRITTTGNIGMGTTSPYAKLSIHANNGETNRALFDISSSTVAATTSLFTILNNGNVGVGTSVPSFGKFQVNAVSGTSNLLTLSTETTTANNYPAMSFQAGTSGSFATPSVIAQLKFNIHNNAPQEVARIESYTSGSGGGVYNGSLIFYTQNSSGAGGMVNLKEKMRIESNGNVGIGNSTPSSTLFVQGTTTTNVFTVASSTGTNLLTIVPSGNVGVGTTTPWGLLSVNANGLLSGAPQFVVGSSTATNFIVANNGNVGIGTTTPGTKLDVYGGDITVSASALDQTRYVYIKSDSTSSTDLGGIAVQRYNFDPGNIGASMVFLRGNAANDTHIVFRTTPNGGSLTERMRIDRNGLVGIGTTSPATKLDVYGTSAAPSVLANNGILTISGSNTAQLSIGSQTASPYGMFLQTKNYNNASGNNYPILLNPIEGNVGIGTTTPWRTLSVNGTVAVAGLVNDSTGYYACVNTTTGQLSTSTTACGASSEKYKENIENISYGLNEIMQLRPVSFDYKDSYIKDGRRQVGFIAEEVAPLIPEVVSYDDTGEIQGLDYPKFVSVIVKAIQEMNKKIDDSLASIQVAFDKYLASNEVYIRSANVDDLKVNGNLNINSNICVDDTCITKEQFKEMILRSGVGAVQVVGGSGEGDTEGAGETASSTPEIISETSEENATTTEEVIEEVATTTPEVVE